MGHNWPVMPRAKKEPSEKPATKPKVAVRRKPTAAPSPSPTRRSSGALLAFAAGALFLSAAAGAAISSRATLEAEAPTLTLPNPNPTGEAIECAPLREAVAELERAERELGAWIGWGQVSARAAEIAVEESGAAAAFTPPTCPDGSSYPEFRGDQLELFASDIRGRTDELTPQLELFRAQREAALADLSSFGCR